MNALSRLNRDVRSETSVFNRDVTSQRHASTVTFEREPSLLSNYYPHPTGDPDPMRSVDAICWLDCAATGCDAGMAVDVRHIDNLTASGGWYCREHESEVPC